MLAHSVCSTERRRARSIDVTVRVRIAGFMPRPRSWTPVFVQGQPLTKAQISFQRLVAKIEAKRALLKQWQDYLPRFNQRVVAEMEPLHAQLRHAQRQMVDLIDTLLGIRPEGGRRLTKRERAKLRDMIVNLISGLLEFESDSKLEQLHDKYSHVSRDEMRQFELEMAESFLSDVIGMDVGENHGAASAEGKLHLFDNPMLVTIGAATRIEIDQRVLILNPTPDQTAMNVTDPILQHFHSVLAAMYGARLERVVLYGSRARGDERTDSDYDVAVFLSGIDETADRWSEADRIAAVAADILMETGAVIHAMPYRGAAYQERTPLMHEIRREGVAL